MEVAAVWQAWEVQTLVARAMSWAEFVERPPGILYVAHKKKSKGKKNIVKQK